jgi:DNA helicase INO80
MLYREGGILNVPGAGSRAGSDTLYLDRLMNIWQPSYIAQSLKENSEPFSPFESVAGLRLNRFAFADSTFAFARGLKYSPAELYRAVTSHGAIRLGLTLQRQNSDLLADLHEL